MGLRGSIQRWRHTRGYGVHSPFGYELVTRCIRAEGCGWYGYEVIDGCFSAGVDRSVRHDARMLLRFMTMLRPASVFMPTGAHAAYQAAVRAFDSRIRVERAAGKSAACDLLCCFGDFFSAQDISAQLDRPGHWAVVKDAPAGYADRIFEHLPEGVMFEGRHNLIVVHRPGMVKQRYAVSIG